MPNRLIKDSFRTSDKIASLTDFEFRLWVSLIVSVDDAGRGDARPAIIKGNAFPLRERVTAKDINDALHGLAAKGCVSLYEVDGKPYFWFPTWAEHQRIRECKPKYPDPPENSGFMPSAEICGELPQVAADCGELRPKSNPNPNTNPNPNPNTPHTPQGGRFAEFWAQYPKKVGKGAAEKAFDRIKPDKQTFDRMMSAISVQKQSRQWMENNGQYIPNPATWLNQRRWEDELAQGAGDTDNVFLQMLQEEGQHEPY